MDFGSLITNDWSAWAVRDPVAKCLEVGACLGADVLKQLENDLARERSSGIKVHEDIAAAWSFIDCLSVCIMSQSSINQLAGFINVSKFLKSPLKERIDSAHVLVVVQNHKWASLVKCKVSLEVFLNLLEILLPLSREELEHCGCDLLLSLQLSEANEALLELVV